MENKQEQAENYDLMLFLRSLKSKPQALGGLALARVMRSSLYLSYKKNKGKKKVLLLLSYDCELP